MRDTDKTPLKVLIIEDTSDDLVLLLKALRNGGFDPTYRQVETATELRAALDEESWQIVISDYSLPNFDAHSALEMVKTTDIPFFVLSGTIGENIAVEMMRAGAQDYVMKGNTTRLIPALHREIDEINRRKAMQLKLQQKEDQLRQAQKMEAIGRLAGGIAHDFNNLLGVIMMLNDTAMEQLGEHAIRKYLVNIQEATKRAAALPRQLLTFSRRQSIDLTVLELNPIILNIQTMLEKGLGQNVDLKIECGDDLKPTFMDRSQFEQTLMNLVVNGRDAMPDGGELRVKTFNTDISEPLATVTAEIKPGSYTVLSVEDSGCGMDEATIERIFEPFFTTKGERGTGLGLSTVFGIVEQSKGYINVSSKIGKGTRFDIYFPACAGVENELIKPVAQSIENRSNQTLLLVDDQNELRQALASSLKHKGFIVLEAASPDGALAICATHPTPIHILVTDLSMDGMNGSDLIEKVITARPETRAVLISGHLDEHLIDKKKLPPNTPLLQKPFTTAEILAAIHTSLASVTLSKVV